MSEEITKPIVERLKAEGQLTRNTGTNSLRSVKIQLDKFESVLGVISENIAAQTQMMAKSLDLEIDKFKMSQESAEREKVREQMQELEDDQKEKDSSPSGKKDKEKEKDKEGIFGLLGGLGFKNLLLGGALLGGGLFAAYNIAKGFIDEKYDNAWSNFEDNLIRGLTETDWGGVADDLRNIGENLGSLADLLGQLLGIIQGFIDNPWSLFALGLGLGFGPGRIGRMAGGLLRKIFTRGAPGAGTGAGGGFLNFLRNALSGAGRVAGAAATSPAAPLVGAAATTAALGAGLNSKLEMEEQYPELRGLNNGAGVGVAQGRYYIERGLIEDAIEEARRAGTYRMPLDEEALQPGGGDGNGQPESLTPSPSSALPEGYSDLGMESVEDIQNYLDSIKQRDEAALEEQARRTAAANIQEAARLAEIERLRAEVNELDAQMMSMEDDITGEVAAGGDQEAYNELLNQMIDANLRLMELGAHRGNIETSFRTGTQGFQDFGDGTFSILHGREAVVPYNTAAGKFLEQFFDENWSPKISSASNMADRVETVAGGSINMPVIINNSPVSAPVTNYVQGGPSLTSTNLFGGGGGSSGGTIYGLPRSIS